MSHTTWLKMYLADTVATAATPYERWCGIKPDLSHVRVFCGVAYAQVPDKERWKLDKTTVKPQFVGHANHAKGYRLCDEQKRMTVIRLDVIFNE